MDNINKIETEALFIRLFGKDEIMRVFSTKYSTKTVLEEMLFGNGCANCTECDKICMK